MGKELRADIVIGGKADGSFYQLGSALQSLGGQIGAISGKIIEFGKESTQVYTSYEDFMLDTQVALRTQYASTAELNKVMRELDSQAMQWANDTRFTTTDVAGAISEASHAGWDLEKILEGIPDAMQISMAGGMDLSQGLEYLVDITNAAGLSFEDLGDLTDYWAYAANKSSTDIAEMGQAMQKMGATLQFAKGDMAGLTTMLAVLADNGTKGTEAGTLLRNSMLRLIAPTKAAAEAMDGLELSEDDLEDVYGSAQDLEAVSGMLEEAGFSAYDAQGRLKSFLDIFRELNDATAGMTEQDRNKVLSTIFPTRTITGALALLKAARNDWNGLYGDILENGSGYAAYAAETMESGLGGTLRHLESVYNVLQTKTGNEISGLVDQGAGALSGVLERINAMDDTSFSTLVGGLTALAAAGPALTVTGGAIKLISMVLGTGKLGKLVLVGTALATAAGALNAWNKAEYESNFGALAVDTEAIGEHIRGLYDDFTKAREGAAALGESIEAAFSKYTTASGSLKEGLLNTLLTGGSLSSEEAQRLQELGMQMRQALLEGIQDRYGASLETLDLLGGGDGIWDDLRGTLEYGYQGAISEAESLSQQLREAMTSAFADGQLTSDEVSKIQAILEQQNAIMAMWTDAQNAASRQKVLRQAQSMGLDQLDEISQMAESQLESQKSALEDDYYDAYAVAEFGGQQKIASGARKADGSLYTQEDLDRELAALTEGFDKKQTALEAEGSSFLLDLYRSTLEGSGYAEAFSALDALAGNYLTAGTITASGLQKFRKGTSVSDRYALEGYLGEMIDAMGGEDSLRSQAENLALSGDLEQANALQKMLSAYGLVRLSTGELEQYSGSQFGTLYRSGYTAADARVQAAALEEQDPMATVALEKLRDAMQTGIAAEFAQIMSADYTDTGFQTGIRGIVDQLKESYDLSAIPVEKGLESIHDYAAAYRLLFEEGFQGDAYRVKLTPEVDAGQVSEALAGTAVPVEVAPQAAEGLDALTGEEIQVDVDGNTDPLKKDILAEDGKSLTANVDGDVSALAAAIDSMNGRTVTVSVSGGGPSLGGAGGMRKFAEGGRAEEASIFGEGPTAEWAIPEAHTQRTAELLDAARAASGFSWPELLSRNGGLNAGGSATVGTIIYSPTIYAQDAAGVAEKLEDDKRKFEKYLREQNLLREVGAYT